MMLCLLTGIEEEGKSWLPRRMNHERKSMPVYLQDVVVRSLLDLIGVFGVNSSMLNYADEK